MKTRLVILSMLFIQGACSTLWANVLNWPASGWAPLYGQSSLYSDIPDDTGNNGHEYLDFVGDTNYAAAFYYYRTAAESGEAEDQLLFRVRLDSKKNKMPGAYQVFFETSYDSSVDWVLELETGDLDSTGTISFGSAAGTNRSGVTFGTVVWSDSFTSTSGYAHWAGAATGDGSSFNGDIDYFLEFGLPWSTFTNYTGVTSTNDPFRLLFTSSQSGGQIDDGDVGNSSATIGVDVVFDDIYADPDPADGPYTQTISFTNPGDQDSSDTVLLNASASSGLPVSFSVQSGPGVISSATNLTFSGSGTVVIVASQSGNSSWLPAPSVTHSFLVTGKTAATVTLDDLNPTYDGTAQSATATTVPSGLTVDLTYDGSPVAPTNAGSYTVIGTINDPGYEGSATNTFTIAQGTQTLTFPNPGAQVATNSVLLGATSDRGLSVTDYTVISGPGSLSGTTLSFTGAGTVLVSANQSGDANWGAAVPVTNAISVSKATASINVTGLSPTYDGTAQTVTVTTDPSGRPVDITYNGSTTAPTNAGTYTVIVTVNDPLYGGSVTNTFTIAKADQSITFTNPGSQGVSDTVNLSATADSGLAVTFGVVSGPAVLSGSTLTFTNSGAVVISADQPGDANWNAASQTNISFSVGKTAATVTLDNLNPTYDGTAQSATATTVPAGLTVDLTYDGSPVAPTNAGSYTVIGTINDPGYEGSATNTLVISKASQTLTFDPIADQVTTNVVSLSASTTGDGTPEFAVISGPAVYDPSGPSLSFNATGTITVVA
uniref:MBG domain-containing protein n=1 Tax=Pontiella sp. TaxID=2837462 RepID=UPI003561DA08